MFQRNYREEDSCNEFNEENDLGKRLQSGHDCYMNFLVHLPLISIERVQFHFNQVIYHFKLGKIAILNFIISLKKYTTNTSSQLYQQTKINMHRLVCSISKLTIWHKFHTTSLIAPMSGLKLRNSKKSSSTVFAELSSEYLQKYNEDQLKENNKKKQTKQSNNKIFGNLKRKEQNIDLMETQELNNSWLGNALQDDLLVETKQWEGNADVELQSLISDNDQLGDKNKETNSNQSGSEESKRLFSPSKSQFDQSLHLKVKSFKKQLTKTELIANSRKFLEIICNIFPKHQVERITAEIKDFSAKKDLNIPTLISLNIENDKLSAQARRSQQRKLEKQMKLIEKITKDREKKLFVGVRKIFDENLTDFELIDSLLSLLSKSDPSIMNSEDIHKMIYSHEEGAFENEASHHKAEINIILDKKQAQSLLSQKNEQKAIDELISAKKDFLKQSDEIMSKPFNKRQSLDEQSQQDLINVFEEFSVAKDINLNIQKQLNKGKKEESQQQQRQQKKRERSMKLIVKKNIHQQEEKPAIPEQFQINEHSLHQIERILFKNKKIIEDNVVFKKVKSKNVSAKLHKEREHFATNWIYAYEMSYTLEHETCQEFVDYISTNYGEISEYYIFPYKNMLQKRENIMIHIENQKNLRAEMKAKEFGQNPKDKPLVADKLLEKIQKEKNLKLNKSSMVFKFRQLQSKEEFLMPEMRLYGLNYKAFRNVRFEQAQSKKIIAISMIPWGCSSEDLLRAINKSLKPIQVQVSYQACILAKGFIFVEFDNFYECLNACQLLNNLQFQGHSLKVQINYGSSKIYGQQYKNVLEFDHYETLVKKLKEIKCFYNEVYKD